MSTVKKFEKQPVIPDPPNTRTDTKAVFLQKADAFNPGLKAWADSFNTSVIDNLNALVDVLNQQIPYINTVSDADAAIRAVYTAITQVNTVSAGIESVNACATWMDKIKLVAENMAEVVSAQGYAEEAKKWALMAEAVVNVRPATPNALGLIMPRDGLSVDGSGIVTVDVGQGLEIDSDTKRVKISNPLSTAALPDAIPVSGIDGRLDSAWIPFPSSVFSNIVAPSQVSVNETFSMNVSAGSDSLAVETVSASVTVSSDHVFSTEESTDVFEESIELAGKHILVLERETAFPDNVFSMQKAPVFSKNNGTVVILCNANNILISRNKGKTWGNPVYLGIGSNPLLKTDSNGTWIAVSNDYDSSSKTVKIAVSHDDFNTWDYQELNTNSKCNAIITDGKGMWFCVFDTTGGEYLISLDNGDSWSTPSVSPSIRGSRGDTDGDGTWIFSTYVTDGGGTTFSISTDNCKTFTNKTVDFNGVYTLVYAGNGYWFVTTSNGSIYISTDKGLTWTIVTGLYGGTNASYIYSSADVAGNIFSCGTNHTRFNIQKNGMLGTPNSSKDYSLINKNLACDGYKTWIGVGYLTLQRMLIRQYYDSIVENKITSAVSGQSFTVTLTVTDSEGNVHKKEAAFTVA